MVSLHLFNIWSEFTHECQCNRSLFLLMQFLPQILVKQYESVPQPFSKHCPGLYNKASISVKAHFVVPKWPLEDTQNHLFWKNSWIYFGLHVEELAWLISMLQDDQWKWSLRIFFMVLLIFSPIIYVLESSWFFSFCFLVIIRFCLKSLHLQKNYGVCCISFKGSFKYRQSYRDDVVIVCIPLVLSFAIKVNTG